MRKVLWMDTETSGTDEDRHAMLDLSVIIEIDREIISKKKFQIKPFSDDILDPQALEVNGYTEEMVKQEPFLEPLEAHMQICGLWGSNVDKFEKSDKMYIGGFNVDFDLRFLTKFFEKCQDKYLGSWINWRKLDPMPLVTVLEYLGKVQLPNLKLETLCDYYQIPIDAHDSMSDIMATRELFYKLINRNSGEGDNGNS